MFEVEQFVFDFLRFHQFVEIKHGVFVIKILIHFEVQNVGFLIDDAGKIPVVQEVGPSHWSYIIVVADYPVF